jgi:hypothetical protein
LADGSIVRMEYKNNRYYNELVITPLSTGNLRNSTYWNGYFLLLIDNDVYKFNPYCKNQLKLKHKDIKNIVNGYFIL